MTGPDRELEKLLRSVLWDVPPMPDRVLAGAIAGLPSTPQRRAGGTLPSIPRWALMSARTRSVVVIGAAIIAALLAAALLVVGRQPSAAPAFAPGSLAFVRDGSLEVTAPGGSGPVTFPSTKQVYRLAFAPDRKHLAIIDQDELSVLTPDGTVVGRRPLAEDSAKWVGWTAGGSELVVEAEDQEHLVFIGLGGQEHRRIALPGGFSWGWPPDNGSVSPDGRWIALFGCVAPCDVKFDPHILVVSADGSGWQWLTTQTDMTGYSSRELWSPDSRLTLGNSRTSTIEVLSPDGGPLHTIPSVEVTDAMAWSPDGSTLAVGGPHLSLVDADGAVREVELTWPDASSGPLVGAGQVVDLAWSGDGRSLVFAIVPDGAQTETLYLVDRAGGIPQPLAEGIQYAWTSFDVASGD